MIWKGIALGGHKCAGKDLATEYILRTRDVFNVLRCKEPLVTAFERAMHRRYVKSNDDALLMEFSRDIARALNPYIVAEFLADKIPKMTKLPIIPDMRFHVENQWLEEAGICLIKIDALPLILRRRTEDRDGHLGNFNLDDDTEREIDDLKYHYIIPNNGAVKTFINRLEEVLHRGGPEFFRRRLIDFKEGSDVRVTNIESKWFWDKGQMKKKDLTSGYIDVYFPNDDWTTNFHPSDLMPSDSDIL